jgi:hypothetical protein
MRALALFLALFLLPAIGRGEPADPNPEIAYLLQYVENSNVRFIRGGREYSAREAAAHLE